MPDFCFLERISSLIVVDVSPVNKKFTVSDATEWSDNYLFIVQPSKNVSNGRSDCFFRNMSHFFHALMAVTFEKGQTLSQVQFKRLGSRDGNT
jgi:hypothetical protein